MTEIKTLKKCAFNHEMSIKQRRSYLKEWQVENKEDLGKCKGCGKVLE